MKPTERINRIHREINLHFPSNNDAWWVSNGGSPSTLILHRGYGGDDINPRKVAEYIFRTEPSVHVVFNNCGLETYTRAELCQG